MEVREILLILGLWLLFVFGLVCLWMFIYNHFLSESTNNDFYKVIKDCNNIRIDIKPNEKGKNIWNVNIIVDDENYYCKQYTNMNDALIDIREVLSKIK